MCIHNTYTLYKCLYNTYILYKCLCVYIYIYTLYKCLYNIYYTYIYTHTYIIHISVCVYIYQINLSEREGYSDCAKMTNLQTIKERLYLLVE